VSELDSINWQEAKKVSNNKQKSNLLAMRIKQIINNLIFIFIIAFNLNPQKYDTTYL